MRFAPIASCIVCVALAGLSGCNSLTTRDRNRDLDPSPNSPIADVPIPIGYTMSSDSTSKVVPGNQIRFVDHHYKGDADLLPLVKFYRDHMPEFKWNLVDQNQTAGSEVTMHYTKNSEDCYVSLTPGRFGYTYIRVRIDPIGRDINR
jgi:hypothetical protein